MLPLRAREPVPGFLTTRPAIAMPVSIKSLPVRAFPAAQSGGWTPAQGLRRQLAVAGDESLQKNVRKLNSGFVRMLSPGRRWSFACARP